MTESPMYRQLCNQTPSVKGTESKRFTVEVKLMLLIHFYHLTLGTYPKKATRTSIYSFFINPGFEFGSSMRRPASQLLPLHIVHHQEWVKKKGYLKIIIKAIQMYQVLESGIFYSKPTRCTQHTSENFLVKNIDNFKRKQCAFWAVPE